MKYQKTATFLLFAFPMLGLVIAAFHLHSMAAPTPAPETATKPTEIVTYAIASLLGANGSPGTTQPIDKTFGVALHDTKGFYYTSTQQNRVYGVWADGSLQIIAGSGISGFSGDGGSAKAAQLKNPTGVALDSAGNLYIADSGNNRIRKVNAAGRISTFAGKGLAGFSGDGGEATTAQLNNPVGIAVDFAGTFYIADSGNNRIRKVTRAGIISTVAGNGTSGFSGDGEPAVSAQISLPRGVALDSTGNLYIVDTGNNRIRKITPAGIINTVVGSGASGFSGDGGPATEAKISPSWMAVDSAGNLYIAESGNHRIRMVNTAGIINTIAGNGTAGFSGDGGPATAAQLNYPTGIALDSAGNLYIADSRNNRIRKLPGVAPKSDLVVQAPRTAAQIAALQTEDITQRGRYVGAKPAYLPNPNTTSSGTLPLSIPPFIQAIQEWDKANSEPVDNAGAEARTAYYKKRLQFFEEWLGKHPEDSVPLDFQFNTLSLISATPDEMLVQKGNQILAADRNSTGPYASSRSFMVLRVWAQRGLELNRIPALAIECREKQKKNSGPRSPLPQSISAEGPLSQTSISDDLRLMIDADTWAVLVTASVKSGQTDQARAILREWETALNASREQAKEIAKKLSVVPQTAAVSAGSPINALPQSLERNILSRLSFYDSMYYEARAQVAASDGQLIEALTFYQTSIRLAGKPSVLRAAIALNTEKEANKIWTKLGGSQDGWVAWLESVKTEQQPSSTIPIASLQELMRTTPGLPGRSSQSFPISGRRGGAAQNTIQPQSRLPGRSSLQPPGSVNAGPGFGGGIGVGPGMGSQSDGGIGSQRQPFDITAPGVTAPGILEQPSPPYTPEARKARITGIISLKCVIRKDGTVDNINVVKGLGYGLDESAVKTIQTKWRFTPATYNGEPIDVTVSIEVNFRIF